MNDIDELKAELERVQKQAAAMRDAIKYCIADWKERHVGLLKKALEPTQNFPTPYELRAKAETYNFAAADLEHALKSDAGANYISKEQVKPLVVALDTLRTCSATLGYVGLAPHVISTAIAHARSLGL